ncbi:MAG TPA: ABC transporter permease [Ohtaekwangia sp.]
MLQNYIKIALRNIQRNSIYSFINVFGLAIGLCSVLLIMLWTSDEIQYDKFHENADHIYQVLQNNPGDNGILTGYALPLPLVEEFKTNERDIKYVVPTDWGSNHLLTVGDKRITLDGLYAGEDFLKVFTFPMIKGNVSTALSDAGGIVLTASTAKALFGEEEALGKVIRVDNDADLTVTGIVADVPTNSSLQFNFILPFSYYIASQEWVKNVKDNWGTNSFLIYVSLTENTDVNTLQARVKDVIEKHEPDSKSDLIFHPMKSWRLYSQFENGKSAGGTIDFIRSISIVAGLILLIACINFMNLATARSEHRAREVGIRKTIGSKRKELILQFLGESVVVACFAFVLSIVLAEIALPFYNALTGKQLAIPYGKPLFWEISLAIVFLTGLIAGSYPAFYLSSFRAAAVLKGNINVGRKATPRKVLVTVQFFFTIFHIIGAIVFYKQVEHGKDRYLGYDRENLLLIENSGDISKNYKAIKQALIDQGLALGVTQSNSPITQTYAFMSPTWAGKSEEQHTSFATIATEYDYLKTTGIKLLEGRDFSEKFNDSSSIILNKAAVDYIGLKKPIGDKITWDGKDFTIIGVTENILSSPYQKAGPFMFVFMPDWISDYTIRMPADKDLSETLQGIEKVFNTYNPAYPFQYRFADDEFNRKFTSINLIASMAYIFSGLAIIISCLGLFGLAAFTAEQRSKEIGIRKVMGATVTHVVMLLSKDFTKLIVIAFVLAAPGSWFLFDMWLQRFPYRIPMESSILIGAGFTALFLAITTVSFQAIKAAVADPVKSLRSE